MSARRRLQSDRPHVLVLDDDPKWAQSLVDHLESAGIPCISTTQGEEALSFARQNGIGGSLKVALVDEILKRVDEKTGIEYSQPRSGSDIIKELTEGGPNGEEPIRPDLKIIVITSQAMKGAGIDIGYAFQQNPYLSARPDEVMRIAGTLLYRSSAQFWLPGVVGVYHRDLMDRGTKTAAGLFEDLIDEIKDILNPPEPAPKALARCPKCGEAFALETDGRPRASLVLTLGEDRDLVNSLRDTLEEAGLTRSSGDQGRPDSPAVVNLALLAQVKGLAELIATYRHRSLGLSDKPIAERFVFMDIGGAKEPVRIHELEAQEANLGILLFLGFRAVAGEPLIIRAADYSTFRSLKSDDGERRNDLLQAGGTVTPEDLEGMVQSRGGAPSTFRGQMRRLWKLLSARGLGGEGSLFIEGDKTASYQACFDIRVQLVPLSRRTR